jgi:hypothetical protein
MLLTQRLRLVRRAAAAAGVFTISLAGVAVRAGAEASAVLDPKGVSVAAYGGWAAWSRLDAMTNHYALVVRSPRGTISLAPVAPSASPFDIELGPSGSGVAAVYSRCADTTLRGCRIAELHLGATPATELALAPPGGGSVHEPAIWENRVVFLRRNSTGGSEDPSHPGRKPDSLFAWDVGSRKLHSLALPVSRGSRAGAWPSGLTGLITGLTFNGKQLGYATSNVVGSFGETSLWFEPLGGGPELIDQETSGAGNVCQPEFVSPVLAGRWLYAYLHACDPSGAVGFDRFTRYRHGEVDRARFTFIRSGDEPISSVVPDGAGVDWGNRGVQTLATLAWRRIGPPVAQTFCSRTNPFC